ncbi:hypothetical protein DSO57_1026210 [Entomophthora muscae]|uniref:Uncharacterized protein n=1 Tax=Entomophthora muscae TaxID=34485 RepID=A0ACC2T314_9FUNG|nr:hypothetical protein DSO57_1026210 [Entomophthora muscae]
MASGGGMDVAVWEAGWLANGVLNPKGVSPGCTGAWIRPTPAWAIFTQTLAAKLCPAQPPRTTTFSLRAGLLLAWCTHLYPPFPTHPQLPKLLGFYLPRVLPEPCSRSKPLQAHVPSLGGEGPPSTKRWPAFTKAGAHHVNCSLEYLCRPKVFPRPSPHPAWNILL